MTCKDCPHVSRWHNNGDPAHIESGYCEVSDNAVLANWPSCEYRIEELQRAASKEPTC